MKKLEIPVFLITILLNPVGFLHGEKITVEWKKIYKREGDDFVRSIIKTSDKNYLIFGNKMAFYDEKRNNYCETCIFVTKVNSKGEVIWEKLLESNGYEIVSSVIESDRRGYLVVGSEMGYGEGAHWIYLAKLSINGKLLWEKFIGIKGFEEAASAVKMEDGKYLIVGTTSSNFKLKKEDVYLLEVNEKGDVLKQNVLGGNISEKATSVIKTSDGNYLIVGYTSSHNSIKHGIYIVKVDKSLNPLWIKTYGGNIDKIGDKVIEVKSAGGYIVLGHTEIRLNKDIDIYLLRINDKGKFMWQSLLEERGIEIPSFIKQIFDGYLIVGQKFDEGFRKPKIYLAKVNKTGKLMWQKTLGGGGGNSIVDTPDGGYLIAGTVGSHADDKGDAELIKIKLKP